MPCNPLNSTLNRYEQWSNSDSFFKKNVLSHTATVPLAAIVVGKIVWDTCVKLPLAIVSSPINLLIRTFRYITFSGKSGESCQNFFYSPLDVVRIAGKILQFTDSLIYCLFATLTLQAALDFFKGSGDFKSKLESKRIEDQIKAEANKLSIALSARAKEDGIAEGKTAGIEEGKAEANAILQPQIARLTNELSARLTTSEAQGLQDQLTVRQQEINRLSQEKQQVEERLNQAMLELGQKTTECDNLNNNLTNVKGELDELNTKYEGTLQALENLQNQITGLNSNKETLEKKIETLSKTLEDQTQEIDQLKTAPQPNVDPEQLNQLQEELKKVQREKQDLEKTLKEKEEALDVAEEQKQATNTQLNDLKSKFADLKKQLSEMTLKKSEEDVETPKVEGGDNPTPTPTNSADNDSSAT